MKRLLFFLLLLPSFVSGQLLMSSSNNRQAVLTETINNHIVGVQRNQNQYVGFSGTTAAAKPGMLNDDFAYSNVPDNSITMQFWGFRVYWYSEKYPSHGIIGVSIDGGAETLIDQYNATEQLQLLLYASPILTQGLHTIRLRVTGNKNALSSNTYLVHDYFKIFSNGSTPPDETPPPVTGVRYVNQATGNDGNPCTSGSPCATIQRGVNVAVAGDDVWVYNGTYRETVIPPISGSIGNEITIKAAPGQTPIISGLNVVNTLWTQHSGNIYRTTISLPVNGYASGGIGTNTEILANQIFKNGDMQIEARWPDGVKDKDDLWEMTTGTSDPSGNGTNVNNNLANSGWRHYSLFGTAGGRAFTPTTLTDAAANVFPTNSLIGATIITQGWFFRDSRTITANNGSTGQITWSGGVWGNNANDQQFRRYYYLTGQLQFLNQEREYWYEGGTLYYYQPGGGIPSGTIEYKARNWGFDLRSRSYITLEGLTFIGCEPATGNTSTNYCTIDNIRASHMNHNVTHRVTKWQGYGMSQFMGTKLIGTGNVVKNSEFSWSASAAVWIGAGGTVENNKFEWISYDGMWGAPVQFWGDDNVSNIKVLNNTMAHLGRGAIDNGYAFVEGQVKNVTNNEIAYNDISDFAKLNHDGGAFYSWGYQNLSGLRIHHNWIHDMVSFRPPVGTPASGGPYFEASPGCNCFRGWTNVTDGIMAAIYFDMGSGATIGQNPVTVDHNVTWNLAPSSSGSWNNNEVSAVYTQHSFTYSTKQPSRFYNNTFWGDRKVYTTYRVEYKDIFRNNIVNGEINPNWGAGGVDINYTIFNANQTFTGNTVYGANNSGSGNGAQATNPLFNASGLGSPELHFGLQAGSSGVNTGTTLAPYTDGSSGTPDRGAYERGVTPWRPGYVSVIYVP